MAANRIKGITIEIGGDTTKLQTALKGVNTQVKSTQQQLKDVEKLLKLDPGNTELLAKKQMAMAGGGAVSSADLSGLVSAIREAVSGAGAGSQGGDIVIPVYLGGTMLDEVIVNAQQRANLRSGGR